MRFRKNKKASAKFREVTSETNGSFISHSPLYPLNHLGGFLMQSSLCAVSTSSSSANFHFCWPSHRHRIPITGTAKNLNLKSPLRPLIISNSLKTSFNPHNDFHFREGNFKNPEEEEEEEEENQFGVSYRLPIVVRNSSSVLRYFWDGNKLKLVALDGNSFSLWDFCTDFDDGFRKFLRICASALRNFFLPREVSLNYLDYVKWKFLHRVSSSALQVLATQAMFRAIGIGFSRSLPSAAALNWVLKDGLGRLSRCIYTASLASAFDTNLKRVRFSTSVLFSLSIGVELLTPAFPQYFLLLASIANIAKQISLSCYLATGTAVHRSFAVADNLGEVSAKAQIQTVCFDNLGLILAAVMNIAIKNNQSLQAALPFLVYPIFTALDLFGIYQGLKHVHLQTLTKDRLEIIIYMWIQEGCIPSPAEVSRKESINFWGTEGRKELPIRIGCLNPRNQLPKLSVLMIQALNNEDFYFICMENFNYGSKYVGQHGIVLCLREGAESSDVIMGLMQACHVRKALLLSRSMWETSLEEDYTSNEEWFKLTEDGKQFARANLPLLIEGMSKQGWACKNILLSSQEQARYSFVAD